MKIMLLMGISLFLSACAAGINHNVVTVGNKDYLIETRTRNLFGISQWSESSRYYNIERDIAKQEQLDIYKQECEKEVKEQLNASFGQAYDSALTKCIKTKRKY